MVSRLQGRGQNGKIINLTTSPVATPLPRSEVPAPAFEKDASRGKTRLVLLNALCFIRFACVVQPVSKSLCTEVQFQILHRRVLRAQSKPKPEATHTKVHGQTIPIDS